MRVWFSVLAVVIILLVVSVSFVVFFGGGVGSVFPESMQEERLGLGVPVNQKGQSNFFECDGVDVDLGGLESALQRFSEPPRMVGKAIFVDDRLVRADVLACPSGAGIPSAYLSDCPVFDDAWFAKHGVMFKGRGVNSLSAGFSWVEWVVGCTTYQGSGNQWNFRVPTTCEWGRQRIFVSPSPCTLGSGEFLAMKKFDSGVSVSAGSLPFKPVKFCGAFPAWVWDKRQRVSYTDNGVTQMVRDGVFVVPDYQEVVVFYVTDVVSAGISDVPCGEGKAFDLGDEQCKDPAGFIFNCEGVWDVESGVCVTLFQGSPECPRGSFWDEGLSTCLGGEVDCEVGEAYFESGVWVCRLDKSSIECDGVLVEKDGGLICGVPPEIDFSDEGCGEGKSLFYEGGKWFCAGEPVRTGDNTGCLEGYELGVDGGCVAIEGFCKSSLLGRCPDGSLVVVRKCVGERFVDTGNVCVGGVVEEVNEEVVDDGFSFWLVFFGCVLVGVVVVLVFLKRKGVF